MLEGWQVSSTIAVLSGQPVVVQDTSTDFSGTGKKLDRWSMLGDPKNIQTGFGVPCYGVTGSSFQKAGCVNVAIPTGAVAGTPAFVANLPAACVSAASSELFGTTPNPATPGDKNASGLLALGNFGCYYENGTAIVPPAQGTFGNMGRNVLRNGVPYREWDASVTKSWKIKERLTTQFRAEIFNLLNQTIYALPSGKPTSPSTFGVSQTTNNTGDPILGNGGPRQIVLSLKFVF